MSPRSSLARLVSALIIGAGAIFVVGNWDAALAQGCAMCQTVMPKGDEQLAHGMVVSVLLLMAMPFVVVTSIGGWVFYSYWRARRRQDRPASVLPLRFPSLSKEEEP